MTLKPATWCADTVAAFASSVAASPFGRLKAAEEMLSGSHLFEFEHGRQAALLAVRARQYAAGREFAIVGAVAMPGSAPLQAGQVFAAVEALARQNSIDAITFCTVHQPLARAAVRRAGFDLTGHVLVKSLNPSH